MEKVDERGSAVKVVITGPESTGKTTLTQALAKHFKTDYVPEYARQYLEARNGEYVKDDLLIIAKGQIRIEDECPQINKPLIICDTSLEVIKVWSEWKYGNCDPFIEEQARLRLPNLFLLLKPDFPWQPDPLRENSYDRTELFAYYQKLLKDYKTNVVEISGDDKTRINGAIRAIEVISEEY
jgi:NadR type nicotinamide-nucleotide adenylyltransferase